MSDRNDVQIAMSDAHDADKSLDQMKTFMELRGLQPNTVYTFALCARRFLAHAGKTPTAIKAVDVESFLLDLTRKGRSPQTRNVNLSAVRCLLFATVGDDSRVITAGIPNARVRRRSPEILSGTEVERLLATSAGTPIAWPSATLASSAWTTRRSSSVPTAATPPHCRRPNSSQGFFSTSYPTNS